MCWTVEVFWVVVSTLDTVAHVGSNSVKMHFFIFFVTENCVTGEYQCVIIRPISQVSFAQDPFCVGLLPLGAISNRTSHYLKIPVVIPQTAAVIDIGKPTPSFV